uniref:Uncharacterized protein n=1 Tax=Romanomermis culicivorax TaxID=13658 RepID=A0A915IK34_ROMCU
MNKIYDEAGAEIETIRYYELQFHVLQSNIRTVNTRCPSVGQKSRATVKQRKIPNHQPKTESADMKATTGSKRKRNGWHRKKKDEEKTKKRKRSQLNKLQNFSRLKKVTILKIKEPTTIVLKQTINTKRISFSFITHKDTPNK